MTETPSSGVVGVAASTERPVASEARTSPGPSPGGGGPSVARIMLGLVTLLIGGAWLFSETGGHDVDWRVIGSISLVAVGVGVAAASMVGQHKHGLISLGVLLTVVLLAASIVDAPLSGGVGDRSLSPATVTATTTHDLSAGTLTLDLSRSAITPGSAVNASVGAGQVIVVLPSSIGIILRARVGAGTIDVDATGITGRRNGVAVEWNESTPSGIASPSLTLNLRVGVGDIQVRRD